MGFALNSAGRGTSVYEIIAAVKCVSGRTVPLRVSPRRAGDPPMLSADPIEAERLLSFCMWLNDITEIMEAACPFYVHSWGATSKSAWGRASPPLSGRCIFGYK